MCLINVNTEEMERGEQNEGERGGEEEEQRERASGEESIEYPRLKRWELFWDIHFEHLKMTSRTGSFAKSAAKSGSK